MSLGCDSLLRQQQGLEAARTLIRKATPTHAAALVLGARGTPGASLNGFARTSGDVFDATRGAATDAG